MAGLKDSVASKLNLDKNRLVEEQTLEVFHSDGTNRVCVSLFSVDNDEKIDHVLVYVGNNNVVQILDRLLPSSKDGWNNHVAIESIKNHLFVTVELSIARPVSMDRLSFSLIDNSFYLDTIATFVRDYDVPEKDGPFLLRGMFKTSSEIGRKSITELDILEKSEDNKGLYYDLSQFGQDNISYSTIETELKNLHHHALQKYKAGEKKMDHTSIGP